MKKDYKWIIEITVISFIITALLTFLSNLVLNDLNIIFGIIIILLFISIGVLFDVIGIAVATTETKGFHAMASKKIGTAQTAIKLAKISPKIASFCNDVVGDICNIISGASGIAVAIALSPILNVNKTIMILLISSIIAALTIGGKALGKTYAINKSEDITYFVAKLFNKKRNK